MHRRASAFIFYGRARWHSWRWVSDGMEAGRGPRKSLCLSACPYRSGQCGVSADHMVSAGGLKWTQNVEGLLRRGFCPSLPSHQPLLAGQM